MGESDAHTIRSVQLIANFSSSLPRRDTLVDRRRFPRKKGREKRLFQDCNIFSSDDRKSDGVRAMARWSKKGQALDERTVLALYYRYIT